MSKVELTLPDDRWFKGEWDIRPKDKEICVVIHRYGFQTPGIYQYRHADFLHSESDYFLDVYELWDYADFMLTPLDDDETWNFKPSFLAWKYITHWKPLGLPVEVDKRPKIPKCICASELHRRLGIISPARYYHHIDDSKVIEFVNQFNKYLCYERKLNKDMWKSMYRRIRIGRRDVSK